MVGGWDGLRAVGWLVPLWKVSGGRDFDDWVVWWLVVVASSGTLRESASVRWSRMSIIWRSVSASLSWRVVPTQLSAEIGHLVYYMIISSEENDKNHPFFANLLTLGSHTGRSCAVTTQLMGMYSNTVLQSV